MKECLYFREKHYILEFKFFSKWILDFRGERMLTSPDNSFWLASKRLAMDHFPDYFTRDREGHLRLTYSNHNLIRICGMHPFPSSSLNLIALRKLMSKIKMAFLATQSL